MPVSEETFERVALEDTDGTWELHRGRLRSKPGMTAKHNRIGRLLGLRLLQQVPFDAFEVCIDSTRLRISPTRTYIPDVAVLPRAYVERMKLDQPNGLEVYAGPVPLVVGIWSPSTGDHDRSDKLLGYQQRGDAEIWLLRQQERRLLAYVRRPDGSYVERVHHGGIVHPRALPSVAIDLDELFNL